MSRNHHALRSTRPGAIVPTFALALLFASMAGCGGRDATASSSDAGATFAAPADGAHIAGSIDVRMQAAGVTIEPAGEVHEAAGHFHVMVDTECVASGTAIPKDGGHRHFGKGQSDTRLSLPPGEHTLCLQVGDGAHVATALTDTVSVTVGVTSLDEWCGVVREVDDLLDGSSLDAPLEELKPIHTDVIALTDQLAAGIDEVDAEHRDDVLEVISGQQLLSRTILDATDATAMRAAVDEVMSKTFVVAEGTYEWVSTTCGMDDSTGDDSSTSSGAPAVQAASHGDVRVIVDQSPTVSDVGALGFLAARPDVEILAVTMPGTGEADCSPGAVTTRTVLDAAGDVDVPIGCGGAPLAGINEWPVEWQDSADALAEIVAPGVEAPPYYDAVSVLLETLASADAPVTIVALGPLTNIATLLETDPSMADHIERIVVMGGAVSVDGNVEPDRAAEWNFHAHPGAAKAVLDSGVPIALVPLDATDEVPLTSVYVDGVASIDHALARVEAAVLGSLPSLDGMFMWDELAAVLTVQPEVARWEERTIVVGDDGATVESPQGRPVQVALGADAPSVQSLVLGALNELDS